MRICQWCQGGRPESREDGLLSSCNDSQVCFWSVSALGVTSNRNVTRKTAVVQTQPNINDRVRSSHFGECDHQDKCRGQESIASPGEGASTINLRFVLDDERRIFKTRLSQEMQSGVSRGLPISAALREQPRNCFRQERKCLQWRMQVYASLWEPGRAFSCTEVSQGAKTL